MKRHIMILTAALALLINQQTARAQFAGGSGTAEDPWRVADAAQLDAVRTNLTAHFLQTADIDLGVVPWNQGAGWVPLGTSSTPFTGVYDGAGFAIRNLTIDRAGSTYLGLFGYLSGATVRHVRLAGVAVHGAAYTGALAGYSSYAVIERVRINGEVTGANYTGGALGYMTYGAAGQIAMDGAVTGIDYTGGVVGYATGNALMRHLCAVGSVQGDDYIGGLLGRQSGSISPTTPELADSWSRAAVTGDQYVGGAVGYMYYSRISRCVSAGAVTGNSSVGGLLGSAASETYEFDGYWNKESSGRTSSARGTGLTTAQMRQRANFPCYNFFTLWRIDEGGDAPVFQDVFVYAPPAGLTPGDLAGAGTAESPYLIGSADELNVMRQALASHYRLTHDIDLAACVTWNAGHGWSPVGTSGSPFTGALDGAGFTIRNLTVNRPGSYHQGLFGYLSGAAVCNLRLENVNVRGLNGTGGLAGYATYAAIENVHVEGEVRGINYTGGVAGELNHGAAAQVTASVAVLGENYTGGIAGNVNGNATARHLFATGSVRGDDYVGGLIGRLSGSTAPTRPVVADSFSRTAVYGRTQVGGAVGFGSYSRVARFGSAGPVGGESTVGGLLGYIGSGGVDASDCYWDRETSGCAASAAGAGLTTAQMRRRASFTTWNFLTLWRIDEGADYPALQDVSSHDAPATLTPADLAGAGTAESPYLIGSADELNVMRQALAAHYRLTNDIDLSASVVWNAGLGWAPVSTFSGTVDGAGFAIRNLTVNRPSVNYQGLFGILNGATVRDLRLEGVSALGGNYTAALAGHATSSTIQNILVTGDVRGADYTGGVVGYMSGGNAAQLSMAGTVRGGDRTGGIAGQCNLVTSVRHLSARGTIEGGSYVGGLAGYFTGNSVTTVDIADSFSHAAVYGVSDIGGALGYGSYCRGLRCFSTGCVMGTGSNVGGFLGRVGSSGFDASDCYWDTETSGQAASARGTGLTTAQMLQRSSFAGYNFFTLWQIDEGADYPVFQNLSAHAPPAALTTDDLAGDGLEVSPYLIGNADELNVMRQARSAHYRLTNDIDLAASVTWNVGQGWEPVGASSSSSFSGTLDGAGFVIRNLTVNRPGSSYQGLFGYLSNATVQNLRLEHASVQGGNYTGGLAGYASSVARIDNVRVDGQVSGGDYTGGALGYMSYGLAENIASACTVRGGNRVGGFAGQTHYNAAVRRAFVLGTVSGGSSVGGLSGYHLGTSSTTPNMSDCFSTASVSGTSDLGGAFGYANYSRADRCYSVGAVSGTGSEIGGFVGKVGLSGFAAANCYWDIEASGQVASICGTGLTTAQMRQASSFVTWNFDTTWRIEEAVAYPALQAVTPAITLDLAARRHANGASGGHAFAVTANTRWNATTADDWINVTDGTTGTNNGVVVYSVAANAVPAQRSGTITVSNGVHAARTFTVYQGAELAITALTNRHDAASSDGHAFVVSGNVGWTAQSDADWIEITGGGSGTDTGTVVYAVADNLSLDPRTNVIVVVGGGIVCTGTVVQAGALHVMKIAPEWREHSASGAADRNVSVTANTAWTATNDVGWISITAGNSGVGGGTVVYSVDANQEHISRLGHVVVTDGESTHRFRVHQVGADTVIITVATEPPESGLASGGGSYRTGQNVTVRAADSDSHTFACWNDGSADVSSNAVYFFSAAADRQLTAKFQIRTFAVNYLAGTGGMIAGAAAQIVCYGSNSAAVVAQPDAGAVFHVWSDGRVDSMRADTNVIAEITATAVFRSTNGSDLDWYAVRGLAPEGGENWADVDDRAVPGKGTTLLHENIADTDPSDPSDVFRVLAIDPGPPVAVVFTPASTARVYTLQAGTNLTSGPWINVQGPRPGTGGADALNDDGTEPARFYRVKVDVP